MGKLTVIDPEGNTHVLDAVEGWPLMHIIRAHNLPLEATCGGACVCATCQVFVDESWQRKLYPPREDEIDKLEDTDAEPGPARLACQVIWHREMDGLRLRLGDAGGATVDEAGVVGPTDVVDVTGPSETLRPPAASLVPASPRGAP